MQITIDENNIVWKGNVGKRGIVTDTRRITWFDDLREGEYVRMFLCGGFEDYNEIFRK